MLGCIVTVTGWQIRHIRKEIPFRRIVALMNYWASNPPIHLMVKWHLGIKDQDPNMIETAQTISVLSAGRKAAKLSSLPEKDRKRFEVLKAELKKNAG